MGDGGNTIRLNAPAVVAAEAEEAAKLVVAPGGKLVAPQEPNHPEPRKTSVDPKAVTALTDYVALGSGNYIPLTDNGPATLSVGVDKKLGGEDCISRAEKVAYSLNVEFGGYLDVLDGDVQWLVADEQGNVELPELLAKKLEADYSEWLISTDGSNALAEPRVLGKSTEAIILSRREAASIEETAL